MMKNTPIRKTSKLLFLTRRTILLMLTLRPPIVNLALSKENLPI